MKAPRPELASGKRSVLTTGDLTAPGLGAHLPVLTTGDKREALHRRTSRRSDSGGYLVADGRRNAFQVGVTHWDLSRQYVAMSVVGACQQGAAVIVGQDNIIGGVKGYVGLTGFTQPATPTR